MESDRNGSASTESPLAADILAGAIVETVRQPLLVLDDGFRVVTANPAFYREFGTRPEETLGRSLWALGDRQWDVAALRDLLTHLLEERDAVEDFEVRHDFESFGLRTFLVNARRVESEGEAHRLLLVAFEDVTERRRTERLLERYTRRLERSNRDLEEFAHAASHDLQEPLRKVTVFAGRLAASVDPTTLDERQRLYLDRMQDAARRMQVRIDDLLQLARVGRGEPAWETVELGAVVDAVLRDLESAVAEIDASIEVGELPTIEADATLLELLFQNLVGNALKYRRPGVRPLVRIAASPVPSPVGDERAWTRVTVTDNGIGFDPAYAERIFRAFERLHGRAEYEGSGVGLAVCRRVAEVHGGTIAASAEPGAGATFEVRLPSTQHDPEL